jgi:cytochrome c1
MLKSWILIGVGLLACGSAAAQEGGIALLKADTDIYNTDSLQRGARNFMNYCSGCHSMKYVRYNRMAEDLKIPQAELEHNLMLTTQKASEGINSAMPPDAATWFGKLPPDLSLMGRERGNDYIYSYLKGFYVDKARQLPVPAGLGDAARPVAAAGIAKARVQTRLRRQGRRPGRTGRSRANDPGQHEAGGV